MWIKHKGKQIYNRTGLMGVLPNSKVEVKKDLGELLVKDFPEWFVPCSAPIVPKDEPKEEPKETKEIKETKKDEVKKK